MSSSPIIQTIPLSRSPGLKDYDIRSHKRLWREMRYEGCAWNGVITAGSFVSDSLQGRRKRQRTEGKKRLRFHHDRQKSTLPFFGPRVKILLRSITFRSCKPWPAVLLCLPPPQQFFSYKVLCLSTNNVKSCAEVSTNVTPCLVPLDTTCCRGVLQLCLSPVFVL